MQKSAWTLTDLCNMMAQLRHPETGCPWDLAQTFESIVPHTLEEAYEVAQAIEQQHWKELPDELGDLMFQVIFYSQLGQEQDKFSLQDILNRLGDKLYRRHPHVFGQSDQLASSDEVLQQWEEGKVKERAAKQQHSLMDDLPANLPALSLAQKTQKRASTVGFDWNDISGVLAKIKEEVDEVQVELDRETVKPESLQEEIGDLLFAVVNLARHCKFDAEQTLRQSQAKFVRRFQQVEQSVAQSSKPFSEHSPDELDRFWRHAKENQENQK